MSDERLARIERSLEIVAGGLVEILHHLIHSNRLEAKMAKALDDLSAAVTALEAAVTNHAAAAIDPAAVAPLTARITAAVATLTSTLQPAAEPAQAEHVQTEPVQPAG